MRNLALCRVCGAHCAMLDQSNQFLPVTRPLSRTGERERCSLLVQGGDASAWPSFCCIVDHKDTEKRTGLLKPWGDWSRKDSAQRGRPAVPDHWTGRPGGSGAQPPLHLIHMVRVEHFGLRRDRAKAYVRHKSSTFTQVVIAPRPIDERSRRRVPIYSCRRYFFKSK